MRVNVLFFASMVNKTGTDRWEKSLPSGSTIEDVKQLLVEEFPACEQMLPYCHVALNQEYMKENPILQPNDEIAFFPPVSGG